ncbi:MAG: hypothetical protein ACYC45_07330 [Acidithiobacillus ferriphilus]
MMVKFLSQVGSFPACRKTRNSEHIAACRISTMGQFDTKGRVGNGACYTSDLKPPVAEIGAAAGGARLLAQKNRKHSEPVIAMIVGILALAVLNIVIYGVDNLNFFIYGTIGIGLTFEYGWIGVILRAAVAGDHDYEDTHE